MQYRPITSPYYIAAAAANCCCATHRVFLFVFVGCMHEVPLVCQVAGRVTICISAKPASASASQPWSGSTWAPGACCVAAANVLSCHCWQESCGVFGHESPRVHQGLSPSQARCTVRPGPSMWFSNSTREVFNQACGPVCVKQRRMPWCCGQQNIQLLLRCVLQWSSVQEWRWPLRCRVGALWVCCVLPAFQSCWRGVTTADLMH